MVLFFELLQVAIGRRDKLSRSLSDNEWQLMFDFSAKQSLEGIAFAGVEKLPKEQWPCQEVLFEWIGLAAEIENWNRLTTDACKDVCEKLEHDGFRICVLKGQANHSYYPKELRNRRTCGDIDVWVVPKEQGPHPVKRVLDYLQKEYSLTGLCWLHANIPDVGGVPVEVHMRPSFMNEPVRNKRFLKLFGNMNDCVCQKEIEDGVVIPALKPEYDVIYQMNHIYRHLIDEGVGLRQIVDYYFLLMDNGQFLRPTEQAGRPERIIDNSTKIVRTVERLGMKRFAGALMYVLREVLAMPEEYMLCAASEKDGSFLLHEIMLAGNFGHDDPRMGVLSSQSVFSRQISQAWRRFKRNLRFVSSYPGEVIWEPFARMYHFAWKKLGLWKLE